MENTISQLFIDLYGNDSARILRAIQNTNTRFLTEELQLSLDREFYSISQKARVLQRLKNSCYLKDIKEMLSFAEKENLRLVFLKGIFLAADLYQKMDSRQSNDIDCLRL
ncbi:MAG: nucleotidyltransferase family protein [Lachnospiraceae bacterium]|nr:nucleotidyltransferase family protein [Lachnospiraceae bacterium]